MFAIKSELKRPLSYWLFVVGAILASGLSQLPSNVHTNFSWWGIAVSLGLLIVLGGGSNVARWLLCALALTFAFATIGVQTDPLEVLPTSLGCLWLLLAVFLLTPSMRAFTHGEDRNSRARSAGEIQPVTRSNDA